MERLQLNFKGIEICTNQAFEEIERLDQGIRVHKQIIEVKEAPGLGCIAWVIIDLAKDVSIGVLAAWIYNKLRKAKQPCEIYVKENFVSIGTVNIVINSEDTQEEILRKLQEIAELPEKK